MLVVAYIYAHEMETDYRRFDKFLWKYEGIFEYPEESEDINDDVENYIEEIGEIVNKYMMLREA